MVHPNGRTLLPDNRLTHRAVLAVAGPIMLSNVTTPLLGIVDTAVIGQIGDAKYIGGVAVGALIFSLVFWAFGFLRMGTTGLTAQAHGRQDGTEIRGILGRALILGSVIGMLLIALQYPIGQIAFILLDGTPQVEALGRVYYDIRIWSAPATLANYALFGWFIGQERAHIAITLQIFVNALNIVLDLFFVVGLGWDVAGIAWGTLIAEYAAAGLGLFFVARHLLHLNGTWQRDSLLDGVKIRRMIAINRDIFFRSLALISAYSWFTAQGAKSGDIILAANAILMQFVTVSAFFLDGFAFAAEALVGKAIGAERRAALVEAIRVSTIWAAGTAFVITLVIYASGAVIIDFLSVNTEVRQTARIYLAWTALMPIISVWCFQLDGIFIGATRSAEMRNAAIMSLIVYISAWWLFTPLGNHGLWIALLIFNGSRSVTLGYYLPGLIRAVPQQPEPLEQARH